MRTRVQAAHSSSIRATILGLSLLAFLGCDGPERISSSPVDEPVPVLAGSRLTGIPFGSFAQPISVYSSTYTGGHLNPVTPDSLLSYLARIKAANGRVALSLPGGPAGYTNADGTFNLDKWKTRVARYTAVNFDSYINDGTVLGNFIIDQPNCSMCWGGQSIPQSTVEAMAAYSKSLWPNMATIARVEAVWLAGYSGQYTALDAGWAQYVMRLGDVNAFLANNVSAAQSKGLRLVVGLNVLNGGANQENLTATQVKDFGSVLMGSPYACAFISWKYDAAYFSRSDIKSALSLLSKKAARHVPSSCSR